MVPIFVLPAFHISTKSKGICPVTQARHLKKLLLPASLILTSVFLPAPSLHSHPHTSLSSSPFISFFLSLLHLRSSSSPMWCDLSPAVNTQSSDLSCRFNPVTSLIKTLQCYFSHHTMFFSLAVTYPFLCTLQSSSAKLLSVFQMPKLFLLLDLTCRCLTLHAFSALSHLVTTS